MSDKPKSSYVKHVPKDAQVILSIMKDMGITDYEPKVINQLLEFTYRYVSCILDDSKIYANHSKKKFIDLEDVRLAVKLQLDHTFTNPPPRDVLVEVAKSKNTIPLPFVKPSNGLRLPPDRYCLNSTNYRLKSPVRRVGKSGFDGANSFSNQSRMRGDPHRGLSIVKRPGTFSSAAKTQNISMPKPVFKLSAGPTVSANSVKNQTSLPTPMQVDSAPEQNQSIVKLEPEDPLKRKREDDDYDVA
ncbi:hypothetical protein QAD02_022072 [Eretmocerus hayati]|uniref:Uncharacterized protein n=1 Tax=Eretmocerus hayati TaxID=131215 RepID=A0ACC2PTG3_9HYME|nr:hypothetical protein QAD02_022072 [Eretmocerus hayati]